MSHTSILSDEFHFETTTPLYFSKPALNILLISLLTQFKKVPLSHVLVRLKVA